MMATKRKPYAKHDSDSISSAIQYIKDKGFSIRQASKKFNIPSSTLYGKLTGTSPIGPTNKCLLTTQEEEKLVKWLVHLVNHGFRKNYGEVRAAAQAMMAARNAYSRSHDGLPTSMWFYSFLTRHPELSSLRKKKGLSTESYILEWYSAFKSCLDGVDPAILDNPARIFNASKIGFTFDPQSKKVKGCIGSKSVSARTQVTVLACSNAVGRYISPLLIYPHYVSSKIVSESFPEATLQVSENGWISSNIFFSWLQDTFLPFTNNLPKPILLLVDEHPCHTSLIEISQLCSEHQIILYGLPPHSSHLIQPLDLVFLSALERAWSGATLQHADSDGVRLEAFAKVLRPVWRKVTTHKTALKSFKAAGIYPFDPEKVLGSGKVSSIEDRQASSEDDDSVVSACQNKESSKLIIEPTKSPASPHSLSRDDVPLSLFTSLNVTPPPVISPNVTPCSSATHDCTPFLSPSNNVQPQTQAAPIKMNSQQLKAIKEYSFFVVDELSRDQLVMFLSQLANPQPQEFPNTLTEIQFKKFKDLYLSLVRSYELNKEPQPKTSSDESLKMPSLVGKKKSETRPASPCPVNGEEALKRQMVVEEEVEKKKFCKKLQKEEKKMKRKKMKQHEKMLREKEKIERQKKKDKQTEIKLEPFSQTVEDNNCEKDPVIRRLVDKELTVIKEDNGDLYHDSEINTKCLGCGMRDGRDLTVKCQM
uniref:HTH CENPB-type domain-containing protein n=1 Tax=Biomphalaria glabrata TaxID=6526 RepID=A0A2C9L399_BIOGL